MGPIQSLPLPLQQGLFELVQLTPWLFYTRITQQYLTGLTKRRDSQQITYLSYYLRHPLLGQVQVKISSALAHLETFQVTGGEGWPLPNEGPTPPLQPSKPLVLNEKPKQGCGW